MPRILLAHADGEADLAAMVAKPLREAGYDVVYEGTILVGESVVQEASRALGAGSPVVLCGTIRAMGTGWAHQVVNAASKHEGQGVRVFPLRMEKGAYLEPLSFGGTVAEYCQDPDKAIKDLLSALEKHYPVAGSAPAAPSSASDLESRYRRLALETHDIVDLANLPVTDPSLATRELQLRSLYVSLRLEVEPTNPAPGPDRYLIRRRRAAFDDEDRPEPNQRRSVGELLARSWRLVILGDPGAGKSTLLRWLATAYLLKLNSDPARQELPDVSGLPDEDLLPVLIRCRDLADPEKATSLERVIRHQLTILNVPEADAAAMTGLLLNRLSNGTALLLIDGLDEITSHTTRARFCRQVVEQVPATYPKAPVIATSRIVGYREMGLRVGRGFEHATVLDLTKADKDEFVRRWCALTELPARREAAEEELIRDIHSTDRIERLTGNPLLLTTMALVKKNVGKLPSNRADLYWEAVKVMLNWRSDVDEQLDPDEAIPQLEYLAYAMCARGVQRLRADEITALLDAMRREYPNVRAARNRTPEEFLSLVERRTAILVEIGEERHYGQMVPAYEFRHLTFQEYLASLALVEGRFPERNRGQVLAENVSPLAVGKKWWEVLRLCVMSCHDDDVDNVLLAMADVGDDEDPAESARTRALLALSCLADEPNVGESVALRLIERISGVLREDDFTDDEASEILSEVGASIWGPPLIRRLVTDWLSMPETGSELVTWASDAIEPLVQENAEDVQAWMQRKMLGLDSADPAERATAALYIMTAAYKTIGNGITVSSDMGSRLLGALRRTGREAEAAALAISWLANTYFDTRPWTISATQKSEIVARIKEGKQTDPAVEHLLQALDGNYSDDRQFAQIIASRLTGKSEYERVGISYARLFPDFLDPVIELIGNSSLAVRKEALRTLRIMEGGLEDARIVAPLISSIQDSDIEFVENAVGAPALLGRHEAIEPLLAVKKRENLGIESPVVRSLAALGESSALKDFHKELRNHDRDHRRAILWNVAKYEPDWADRTLLSKNGDAEFPGIDPQHKITLKDVERYAEAADLTPTEVRERYERLRDKYLLRLAWQIPNPDR